MKKRILAVLFVLLLGSFYVSNAAFAAWTQAKGHSYNQLTLQYYVNDHKWTTVQYDKPGDVITKVDEKNIHRVRTAKFETISTTYYGEYGIIDDLTVFTAIPWKIVSSDDTRIHSGYNRQYGLGDIDFGLRYNLSPNFFDLSGFVMSVQGTVKIPEAYTYGDPLLELSLGDGQYDATAVLQFGRGLGKGYAWLNAGYKWRLENHKFYHFKPSDQIKVSFGGGYAVTSWLSIRGLIDYTRSVGNATISEDLRVYAMLQGQAMDRSKDNILIRDSLGLEPTSLSFSTDLAFTIVDKVQTVLSYGTNIGGPDWADWLRAKDSGKGENVSVALVYMW
jgi:hypothetical protein